MYWLVCILAVSCLYAFLAVAIGRILKDEADELFDSQAGRGASKDYRHFVEAYDDFRFETFKRREKG